MAPLGALSQAWVAAEAALPHGWSITGLWRFGESWVALSEGPDRDYLDASGRYAEQALRRLSDRLRERQGCSEGSGPRNRVWLAGHAVSAQSSIPGTRQRDQPVPRRRG